MILFWISTRFFFQLVVIRRRFTVAWIISRKTMFSSPFTMLLYFI